MDQQSTYGQICIGFIRRGNKDLLSASKNILLSRHNTSILAMLRGDTRLIDVVLCVMNYVVSFELKYDVQVLYALLSDLASYL